VAALSVRPDRTIEEAAPPRTDPLPAPRICRSRRASCEPSTTTVSARCVRSWAT